MTAGISEKYRILIDKLTRQARGPFTARDASRILSISEKDTRLALAYLTRKGWLSRVRQGLYITVPLGTINPQAYKEHPWVVAQQVFAPCYIGGWSAAEHWEFTDQIFNSVVVLTTRKIKQTRMNVQGTDFVLTRLSRTRFGRTKPAWIENTKVSVSDPVQTIVDILDQPFLGGGIRHVADIVREYFRSRYRDDALIVDYIKGRKSRAVYKRLGYLIEVHQIDAAKLKDQCKENISEGFSALDPDVNFKGTFNTHWHLRINADVTK